MYRDFGLDKSMALAQKFGRPDPTATSMSGKKP